MDAVLSATAFPGVALLLGAFMVLVGVSGGLRIRKPIDLNVPCRELPARIALSVIGTFLLTVAVLAAFFGTNIGIFERERVSGPAFVTIVEAQTIDTTDAGETVEWRQNRIKQFGLEGHAVAAYLGDVTLFTQSAFLVFRPTAANEKWISDAHFEYDVVKQHIVEDEAKILYDGTIKVGSVVSVSVDGDVFKFEVKRKFWIAFGSDYFQIQVTKPGPVRRR